METNSYEKLRLNEKANKSRKILNELNSLMKSLESKVEIFLLNHKKMNYI
jgi:hypothetical protein